MENIKEPIEEIIDDIKDYIDTSSDLYKMKATEKAAEIVSSAIINLTLAFLAGFVLLFASLTLAFMLSDFLNNSYMGFLIVSGIYALITLLIYVTKDKWLKHRIIDNFIKAIYSRQHEN